jgi:hypothetical protein
MLARDGRMACMLGPVECACAEAMCSDRDWNTARGFESRLSHHRAYYQLEDAPLVPAPVQRPRPPLVIAAEGTRALRVAAQHPGASASVAAASTSTAARSAAIPRPSSGRASSGGEGRKPRSHRPRPCGTAWAGIGRPACTVSSSVSGARRHPLHTGNGSPREPGRAPRPSMRLRPR